MDRITQALSVAGLALALTGTAGAQSVRTPQDNDYFTLTAPGGATFQFLFSGPSGSMNIGPGTSSGSVQMGATDDFPGFWTVDNETGALTVTIVDPLSLVGTCDQWPDYTVGETISAASERACWLPDQYSSYTLTYHGQQ